MKKLLLILALFALSGCAGMGGNEAYTAAHKVAADSRTAESNNRAKAEEARVLAAASMAKTCKDDVCRAMGFMALMQFGGGVSPTNTPAPVIAPPVNETLEIAKTVINGALGFYGIRVNGAISLVNSTRGAADIDAAKTGLDMLDLYRNTTTSK
jgi:predicted small lipoprotein YifL